MEFFELKNFEYRVKPIEYVPYDNIGDLKKSISIHESVSDFVFTKNGPTSIMYRLWLPLDETQIKVTLTSVDKYIHRSLELSLEELFNDYAWFNGSPCGKLNFKKL